MRPAVRGFGWWVLLLGSGLACGGGGGGDDDGGGGGGGPSLTIAKAGAPNGDGQVAMVTVAVIDSLVVLVQEDGLPKSGATVTWTTGADAAVSPLTSVTDLNGRAATRWTLGSVAGSQVARATMAGATGSPITFTATAQPGPLAGIGTVGGGGQTAFTNSGFTNALSVRVTDQFANPIQGVSVTWSVVSGGVTLTGGAASISNTLGIAAKVVVAGATVGDAVVRATPEGFPDSRDFNLTVVLAPLGITFGNNFFESNRNATRDPAVDTTVVGHAVLWTGTGGTHDVQSLGSPSFPSSATLAGVGATYTVTFDTPGTYQYDCSIHPDEMSGRIVVLP